MHIPKRVFKLAKQCALSGFTSLTDKTLIEADDQFNSALATATSREQRAIGYARGFLRAEGGALRKQMEINFAGYLERAMQTMHTDLRTGLHDINADSLSLIDDEVVTRQIEVDRLVQRLRDADEINLGRINLIIAQEHNAEEVRERENPFRPYLLARALYEAVRELVKEEAPSKLLFDTLSLAMTKRLPGYYEAIHEVFASGGVTARLVARPSALKRVKTEQAAWKEAAQQLRKSGPAPAAPAQAGQGVQAQMLPRLRRLLDGAGNAVAAQDVLWDMFNQPKADPVQSLSEVQSGLDEQLRQLQEALARGNSQPAPLHEQLAQAGNTSHERATIELMSLLFESMRHDEQMSEGVRQQLGQLQLPLLRTAMAEPDLLHEPAHPARRLLDRIGAVGTGVRSDMACHGALENEIARIVEGILARFNGNTDVYAESERELDQFVASALPEADPAIALCVEAINEAEAACARLSDTVVRLNAMLAPLDADPRVVGFLTDTWARVMINPINEREDMQALLPELLWSAQEKAAPQDRATLMRMLPDLVRRVREGLTAIGLREASFKAALDHLVAVHMDVLANKQQRSDKDMDLDALRRHCAAFDEDEPVEPEDGGPIHVGRAELKAALAKRGVTATLHTKAENAGISASADWSSVARAGAGFELMVDGKLTPACLSAVSARQSVYLFSIADVAQPMIFARQALLGAMEEGLVQTVEYAPVFDRAVETLLAGAEALSNE